MTQNEITQSPTPSIPADDAEHEWTHEEIIAHHEATCVDIEIADGTCACGCGDPVSKKATFRMGHDQRFMGIVVAAHRSGKDLAITRGGVMIQGDMLNLASEFLSETGIAKLRRYLANEVKPRKSAKRWESDPAKNQDPDQDELPFAQVTEPLAAEEPGLGAPIKVKVGRWEYNATVTGMSQAGKITAVEYPTKSGPKTATDGKFTIVR